MTSRPRRPRSLWPLLIVLTGIIPLLGMGAVNWSKTAQVAASTFDFSTTGLVEEIICRGFLIAGLSIGFRGRPNAVLKVVVVSAVLFGLAHLNPVQVVFAALFGLAFAHLAMATNTIWIGVVVHILFDLLTDLPDSTKGKTHWSIAACIALVLICSIVAVLRSRRPSVEFDPIE